MNKAIFVLLAALAYGAAAQSAFRVTPYVQHPAPTAMTIKFLSDANVKATVSWWPQGNAGAVQSTEVSPRLAEELQYYGDHHAKQYLPEMTPWQYRCRIENLTPDTIYEYRVELADGASYAKHFRTAPAANRPVRFVCYADCETEPASNGAAVTWDNFAQDQDTNPSATSRKYLVDQTVGYASNICTMVARKPDFFVIAGDLVETGSKQTHWDEFWRHNAGALNDPAGSVPILAALGNHEYASYAKDANGTAQPGEQGAKKFLSYFEFEPNGAAVDADQQQRFHRVDYGPVALIFIDPNNGPDNEPPAGTSWSLGWEYAHPHERDTNAQLYEHRIDGGVDKSSRVPQFQEGSAQYKWLEEQLADAQTNKLFTFLVCHQCPFSAGYHGRASGELGRGTEDENLSGVPTRCLTNLVFKYGVDGWICGHDEMYEHSQVQGEETLPDGTKRPMTLNIWDVGIGGDGLRGCRISENPNPYEVFRAHVDAPEVYDNGDWQTGTLVSGGKHYGHLEVNVDQNAEGLWTATLTPVYNFVSKNAQTGALTFERRTYPDEVVVTNFTSAVPVEIDETKIYVSPTGDGTSPHAGFATGYASINDALAAANAGDTVILDKTIFTLTGKVLIDKAITVCGVGENWETVLDGENQNCQIQITADGALVHTLTYTRIGDSYTDNLGLKMSGASVVSNVVARGNGNAHVPGNGNARFPMVISKGLVTHCWITNNIAPNNAGVSLSSATMENCYIADNVDCGKNPGNNAGIVVLGGGAILRNCTIVNNRSKAGGLWVSNTNNTKIHNNIVWGNENASGEVVNWTGSFISDNNATGNCTSPRFGTAANGNFAANPKLQDDGMHFYAFSPCNHTAKKANATANDIEGLSRGDKPSIGAFEYKMPSEPMCAIVVEKDAVVQPLSVRLSVVFDGPYSEPLSYSWDFNGDGEVDSSDEAPELMEIGNYTVTVRIEDADGKTFAAAADAPVAVLPEGPIVRYVSPTGDGTAPTAGFETGYSDISVAIDAANAGDIVLLDKTTFALTTPIYINKAITVCGAGENWETVLDGENKDTTIDITAAGALLHSLTYTRIGTAYASSLGLKMSANSIVSNVVARQNGNAYKTGNCRYPMQISAGLVTHCWITNNYACNNGGVTLSKARMENCYIADNANLGKNADWYGIVDVGNEGVLCNCTIVDNKSANYVVRINNTTAKVYNNLIWGNTYYMSSDMNNWTLMGTATADSWYGNCTSPICGSTENGNTGDDPLLGEDRRHFARLSPCNHTAVAAYAPSIDMDLVPRGENPSIGAFEYVDSGTLTANIVASDTSVTQPSTITLSCSLDGVYAEPLTYAWDFNGDGNVDSTDAEPVLSAVDLYTPSVTVTDGAGKVATARYPQPIIIFSEEGAVFVTSLSNPNARPPYATRATAATNLADAVTYAQVGSKILLDEGTHYIDKEEIELNKGVIVSGEKGAEKTFLAKHSGDHRLFNLKSKDAVIENVTVKGGMFINYAQGAILIASYGTVRDCRFIGNKLNGHGAVTSGQGGSGVLIERCVFEGNLVSMGNSNGNQGPACIKTNGGQTTIRNCLFVANTNTVSGADKSYWGGAILLASDSAKLVNCTLVGNVSYNLGGAGIYNSANGTVINCISVNNLQRTTDATGTGQYVWLDSNNIGTNPSKQSHSLVWPTTYDYSLFTKVLTEDPQFKTNYTFSSSGPCVRTGLYQDWMKGATDFFGNSRATPGKHVDMGYWQSPAPGLMLRVR